MNIATPVVAVSLAAAMLLSAGCASHKSQAQWIDPEFAGHSLRGEKVLIVCNASDVAVKRICQDRMSARLAASGVVPVTDPESDKLVEGTAPTNDSVGAVARSSGAKAVWRWTVAPDATVGARGPETGYGLGGGSEGSNRSSVGAAAAAAPLGPGHVEAAYEANLVLTDIETGRIMWASKVIAPASRDVNGQIDKLAQSGVEAAQKAGML